MVCPSQYVICVLNTSGLYWHVKRRFRRTVSLKLMHSYISKMELDMPKEMLKHFSSWLAA